MTKPIGYSFTFKEDIKEHHAWEHSGIFDDEYVAHASSNQPEQEHSEEDGTNIREGILRLTKLIRDQKSESKTKSYLASIPAG